MAKKKAHRRTPIPDMHGRPLRLQVRETTTETQITIRRIRGVDTAFASKPRIVKDEAKTETFQLPRFATTDSVIPPRRRRPKR